MRRGERWYPRREEGEGNPPPGEAIVDNYKKQAEPEQAPCS